MATRIGVLAPESRNADTESKKFINWSKHEALHLVVDVTAGSPNLVINVNAYDDVSSKSYTLLTSSTINGGTTVLKLGPDYTAAANVAKDYLPYEWYVSVTQSGGVAATYSVGASMI